MRLHQITEQVLLENDLDVPTGTIAYHATQQIANLVLKNRDIKTYNSMGTWLTPDKDVAKELYGKIVAAYEVPPGRYLLAREDQTLNDLMLTCLPIIAQTVGKKAADHLAKYPFNKANIDFLDDIEDKARKALPGVYRSEGMDEAVYQYDRNIFKRWMAFQTSRKIYNKIASSASYSKQFRVMIEGAGYVGMVWKDRTWDGASKPFTIYLCFHNEDINPLNKE